MVKSMAINVIYIECMTNVLVTNRHVTIAGLSSQKLDISSVCVGLSAVQRCLTEYKGQTLYLFST
jgi:hypothetical protein